MKNNNNYVDDVGLMVKAMLLCPAIGGLVVYLVLEVAR